jgi:hypothetical protein
MRAAIATWCVATGLLATGAGCIGKDNGVAAVLDAQGGPPMEASGPDSSCRCLVDGVCGELNAVGICFNPTCIVDLSDLATSCVTDSDCVAVVNPGDCCASSAIRVAASASTQYAAAVANASVECPRCNVSCGAYEGVCCRGGTCQVGSQCSVVTLPSTLAPTPPIRATSRSGTT